MAGEIVSGIRPTVNSFVYFAAGHLAIGEVIEIGVGTADRPNSHKTLGFKLIAMRPGGTADEAALHREFTHLNVPASDCGGRELFRASDELVDYVTWLLRTNKAADNPETARRIPPAPFTVWEPRRGRDLAIQDDGQMTIFDCLPVKDRVAIKSQFLLFNSESDDWYTPPEWADRAREVMGGIDLDPATCFEANERCIRADHWYGIEQNGLDLTNPWYGRVWLNPPYGQGDGSAKNFVARLIREYRAGAVREAVALLSANHIGSLWFQDAFECVSGLYFVPRRRISFVPPKKANRDSPANANVFVYLGSKRERFREVFGPHGMVFEYSAASVSADEAA